MMTTSTQRSNLRPTSGIRATSTKEAPWYVIPADHKWFTRLAVAAAVVATLDELELHFPVVDAAKRRALQAARRDLLRTAKER